MKFIIETPEEKRLTFEDVKENQLFINSRGALCQKVSSKNYNVIAKTDGKPFAAQRHYIDCVESKVRKIIHDVKGIEF